MSEQNSAMMFQGTGVDAGFKDYQRQLMDSKSHFYESEHEFSPQFTKSGNPIAHPGLPVLKSTIDGKFPWDFGTVINPGTIIALDTEYFDKGKFSFVPANGGTDDVVTYTSLDVAKGVLKDNMEIVEEGLKKTFKANVPAGFIFYHTLQHPATHNGMKIHQLSHTAMAIFTEGFVIMPIMYKGSNNKYDFKPGDYVAPDNPTDDDKTINPNAHTGGIRVWYEDKNSELSGNEIKRVDGIVYGPRRDSLRQAVGKVYSIVDIDQIPVDRTFFNETYGSTNMIGPETKGLLPTYWDIFKSGFKKNKYSESAHNRYTKIDDYNMKLVYILLGKK